MYQMSAKRPLIHDDVYATLCFYNLSSKDRPKDREGREVLDGLYNGNFFQYWIQRFQRKNNINVFVDENWKYFCQFVNNLGSRDGYIKLYIPIDYEHLYDGANILFDFLERNNIPHQSKIGKKVRADNVIIRLAYDDFENAKKIIDFINKNPYLKSGLNKTNPFIPTMNGIGFMQEHGNSYNSDLASYIENYINQARSRGQKNVSAEEFKAFLENCQRNNICYSEDEDITSFDDSILNVINIAYNGGRKELNIVSQQNRSNNQQTLTTDQKRGLLVSALRSTYQKYNMEQVKHALIRIIKDNDYHFITNGGIRGLRDKLVANVSQSEVLEYVKAISMANSDVRFLNVEDMIDVFCDRMFENEYPFVLDDICKVTLENYNEEQVAKALKSFIDEGRTDCFSRYRNGYTGVNYRSKLSMFNKQSIISTLSSSLRNKGINPYGMSVDEMCNYYAHMLSMERIVPHSM
jgi:hypothetical protein